MKIHILYGPPMRAWQARLAEALRATGHDVQCRTARRAPQIARDLATLLRIERRVFGLMPSLFDVVAAQDQGDSRDADLVIALDGVAVSAKAVLEPLFDGAAGAKALIDAVARSPTPSVDLLLNVGGVAQNMGRALLAIEDRDVLSRALDQVLARLISLILQAVRRFEQRIGAPDIALSKPAAAEAAGPRRYIAQGLARKIVRRLSGKASAPNHWRIGFRQPNGPGAAEMQGWDGTHYALLPDDGQHFYADPFPFEHDGRIYLFFEDYPYVSRKGVIGVVEISADGRASAPRIVLEQPFHLSYPFLLRHGGEIYMLPEMSGAGRVQLFRADPFPYRWVPDRILLEGVVASDATPVFHEGRWWLFATLSNDGGSTWDQLGLFHALDFLGSWTAHRDNPVLVDAGAARPAGAMWIEGGRLTRVAQDCRTGYGVGLAICRIDRLDEDGFAQSVVARLAPPAGYGADGVHTLNSAGGLETIDLRFPARTTSLSR